MHPKKWITSAVLLGTAATSSLLGFGVSLGPFSLSLDNGYYGDGYVDSRAYAPVLIERRARIFDNPICYAIQARKLLEMTVTWTDRVDARSAKTTTKRVTIEPYLFGRNQNGAPILRGKIISENIVKEVVIKYGEDPANLGENESSSPDALSGSLSPIPAVKGKSKGDLDTLSVERISNIRVIERSQFNPPKNFDEIFKDGVAEVTCTVSLSPDGD